MGLPVFNSPRLRMIYMKQLLIIVLCLCIPFCICGCQAESQAQIVATTLPVYEFTQSLCEGTGLSIERLITQEVSCLHDFSLQTHQMRMLEGASVVVISGGGLESFLDGIQLPGTVIDASSQTVLHCTEHTHEGHDHEHDPHYWLSPDHAKRMVLTITQGLIAKYPEHKGQLEANSLALLEKLDALDAYGKEVLRDLSCRKLITFHDGFSYFAEHFDLQILHSMEEEAGSEASAKELIELIGLVTDQQLPGIFIEKSGSDSAARIISAETGTGIFTLDMAMAGNSYFEAMYHNIDTVKEALG